MDVFENECVKNTSIFLLELLNNVLQEDPKTKESELYLIPSFS